MTFNVHPYQTSSALRLADNRREFANSELIEALAWHFAEGRSPELRARSRAVVRRVVFRCREARGEYFFAWRAYCIAHAEYPEVAP